MHVTLNAPCEMNLLMENRLMKIKIFENLILLQPDMESVTWKPDMECVTWKPDMICAVFIH